MRSDNRVTPGPAEPTGAPPGAAATDEPLARAVGLVLQWGVVLAAAITAIGGILVLRAHGGDPPQFRVFRGPTGSWPSVTAVVRRATAGDGTAVIECGLLVLLATPVARVVMLLLGFAKERNWLYVALSAAVLGLLFVSLAQPY